MWICGRSAPTCPGPPLLRCLSSCPVPVGRPWISTGFLHAFHTRRPAENRMCESPHISTVCPRAQTGRFGPLCRPSDPRVSFRGGGQRVEPLLIEAPPKGRHTRRCLCDSGRDASPKRKLHLKSTPKHMPAPTRGHGDRASARAAFQLLPQLIDLSPELRVHRPPLVHLPDGVDHGRVIASPEDIADVHE